MSDLHAIWPDGNLGQCDHEGTLALMSVPSVLFTNKSRAKIQTENSNKLILQPESSRSPLTK
jgi:hypothetical protein